MREGKPRQRLDREQESVEDDLDYPHGREIDNNKKGSKIVGLVIAGVVIGVLFLAGLAASGLALLHFLIPAKNEEFRPVAKVNDRVPQAEVNDRVPQVGAKVVVGRKLIRPPRPAVQFNGQRGIRLSETTNFLDLNKDFTIEMWVHIPFDKNNPLYLAGDEAWPNMHPNVKVPRPCGWVLRTRPDLGMGVALDFTIAAELPDNTDSEWIGARGQPEPERQGFQHVAVCRTEDHILLFWAGRRYAALDCKGRRFVPSPTDCFLGPRDNGFFNRMFTGQISDFRISSKARYLEDFTPADRFELDADTLLLSDFSVGAGARLPDRANKHHGLFPEGNGQVGGPEWILLPR